MKPLKRSPWLMMAVLYAGGLLAGDTSRPSSHASYSEPVPVPPATGMREWRYLAIHHSGASKGNAEIIQEQHLRQGMEHGMAYHFLIGNGSTGLADGAVVEGSRWKHQLEGGHSHQEYLNEYGIGICLVGNFNQKIPTARQMRSLAKLVFELQKQFNIPDDRVHGHGQFFGEDSECPGRLFPWSSFWEQVDSIFRSEKNAAITNLTAVPNEREPR